jgi:hypothetical protein
MRWSVAILVVMAVGCASAAPLPEPRPLPEPFEAAVPDEPERPEGGIHTLSVESSQDVEGNEMGAGILFGDETAAYVARLRVSYDELRQLYLIDMRTRGREREIYERALGQADDEVQRQARRAQRSWWEQHGGVVALVGGIVVGIVLTLGVLAATEEIGSAP